MFKNEWKVYTWKYIGATDFEPVKKNILCAMSDVFKL